LAAAHQSEQQNRQQQEEPTGLHLSSFLSPSLQALST
jgi:hypothetical protein